MIFQLIYKTLTTFSALPNTIAECESKGLSNETIKPPFTANRSLSPKLVWINNSTIKLELKESSLKQNKVVANIVNLFIVFEIDRWSQDLNSELTLKDCLFGAVKLTENADPDIYSYSACGTGFDFRSRFSVSNFGCGKNVVIFGVDYNQSAHISDKKKQILILGKDPTQGLDDTAATAEAEYSINFSKP